MSNGTSELIEALKKAGQALAKQITDASELTVETLWVVADENGEVKWHDAKPVARTTIQLDGDSTLIVPVKLVGEQMIIQQELLTIHESNVQNARLYREKIYEMIMEAIKEISGR